ncbi:MAG: 30S ribosomal protein S3 [Armatimonadetes bacterium]|nr:30S ribosomal protein S3 [Armatimonadota bacterium]
MGQKVHPYGLRLGIIRPWMSRWFAEDARYREQLIDDVRIRKLIRERLRNASVSSIAIERTADTVTVIVRTAKPGVVIGRSGAGVDRLNKDIQQAVGRKVHLTVEEVKRPEVDAQLVAESIAHQIERRISFRRAMRQALQRTMKAGGQGMKIKISGRLGGAEIAHSESAKSPTGRVPLHTLRADVDYGLAQAKTNQGNIGIKVWIYKGDIMPERRRAFEQARERAETPGVSARREEPEAPEAAAAETVEVAAEAVGEPEAPPAEPIAVVPSPEPVAEPEPAGAPTSEPAVPEQTPEEGERNDVDA